MSGFGVDTRTIVLSVTLPMGEKLVIRGEHDGVNPGMTWDADIDDVTIPVQVVESTLIDGTHSPLPDPPADLAGAWRRFQTGEHVEPYEARALDEWRSMCAEDAGY